MNDVTNGILARLRDDPQTMIAALAAGAFLALVVLIVLILKQRGRLTRNDLAGSEPASSAADFAELKGRLSQMSETSALRHEELARSLNERLDRVSQHLGVSVEETGRRTADNLTKLYERLAIIDQAQKNLADLSGQVGSLRDILGNKQARGAFGQLRMESIIEDGLPKSAYRFQPELSNGKRPDCLIQLPNTPVGIVVDAKFPLENFEALRTARDETARKEAQSRIRRDVSKHIEDISGKYLIPGETQDTAMLFVPAESVYADLNANFPDLIQKAHRERIVIVSPNMLMLAVQTMMAILKDARMREQTGVIKREVCLLVEDVGRLRERVLNFQRHFGQLAPDVEQILTSAGKIAERGRRIEGEEHIRERGSLITAAAE